MKNLLKIKSIVTLLVVTGVIAMVFVGIEIPEVIAMGFGAVIASLFAKRDSK